MTAQIRLGFHRRPQEEIFTGFEHGGICISIGGKTLTRRLPTYDSVARYDSAGNPVAHPEYYIGEDLNLSLHNLTDAILRFQHGNFDRYTQLSAPMVVEPGDSTIVFSFCDGDRVRIAYQPKTAGIAVQFPTEVAVGHAVNPDDVCRELIGCYQDCIQYIDLAYGDKPEYKEEVAEVHRWADKHIQQLADAIEHST